MSKHRTLIALAAAFGAMIAAPAAHAQAKMYKCIDASGKTYYTQTPPKECAGRTVNELDKRGNVTGKNESLTPEQQAAREAERKKKMEEEAAAKDERRKNAALLDTYASAQDIDDARGRALKSTDQVIAQLEKRIAESGKLTDNERKNQQALLDAKRKERSAINARYDEEKRRYAELTKAGKK